MGRNGKLPDRFSEFDGLPSPEDTPALELMPVNLKVWRDNRIEISGVTVDDDGPVATALRGWAAELGGLSDH